MRRKKKHMGWIIPVILVLALLVVASIGAIKVFDEVSRVKRDAYELKYDMEQMVQFLIYQDANGAQQSLDRARVLSAKTQVELEKPLWKMGSRFAETEYTAAQQLLPLFDRAADELLQPMIDQLRATPLTKLKGENGIHTEALAQLMKFVHQKLPTAQDLVEELSRVPLGRLDKDGKVKKLTDAAQDAFELLDDNTLAVLEAFSVQLEQYPLDNVRTGMGINVALIGNYLGFIRQMMPQLEQTVEMLNAHQNSILLQNELVQEYWEKAEKLLTMYRENQDLAQLAEVILNNENDQYFLIPALNTTETRAIGGYPGAVGAVTIQNGVLQMEGFYPMRSMLYSLFPRSLSIPESEKIFFHSPLSNPQTAWDACHCPDYEWVARIWAASHEEMIGYPVDGVIALNPTVIQRLLKITGEIVLSDGTVLNGDNATRALERDLYFKYFQRGNSASQGNYIADALFAETARKTMDELTENLKLNKLPELLTVARETMSNQNALVWMKDEARQQIIRELGFSGGLDVDSDKAELGIYFNCTDPSKMGWFAEMEVRLDSAEMQEDGSTVYPGTIILGNSITEEEINQAGPYILGFSGGNLACAMYIFAPRDAEIRQVTIDGIGYTEYGEYQGLKAASLKSMSITRDKNVEIHFQLVVPQGFDRPLVIRQTPLLQDYH